MNPMVFCGLFPIDNKDYNDPREALEKLQLNDASLEFEPESSTSTWFWIQNWIFRNVTYGDYSRKN